MQVHKSFSWETNWGEWVKADWNDPLLLWLLWLPLAANGCFGSFGCLWLPMAALWLSQDSFEVFQSLINFEALSSSQVIGKSRCLVSDGHAAAAEADAEATSSSIGGVGVGLHFNLAWVENRIDFHFNDSSLKCKFHHLKLKLLPSQIFDRKPGNGNEWNHSPVFFIFIELHFFIRNWIRLKLINLFCPIPVGEPRGRGGRKFNSR